MFKRLNFLFSDLVKTKNIIILNVSYFFTNWLLSTNHKRIAVMYFIFITVTAFSGLLLATIIRVELSLPGRSFLNNNAEKYLTIISLHGVVMVFFVVIPAIFGGFGNFLLPTQLGVRDVAFPRLNSFMFWVTPSGFVLLMHIFFFDKSTNVVFSNESCKPSKINKESFSHSTDSLGNSGATFDEELSLKFNTYYRDTSYKPGDYTGTRWIDVKGDPRYLTNDECKAIFLKQRFN